MINLLPTQYKRELKQEESFRLVLILGALFLIFLVSLILILFSIKIYIQGQKESLKILIDLEEETFQIPENRHLRKEIASANQELAKLKLFYQEQTDLTEILEKISQILPQEMYLTTFFWQESASRITLSGFSPLQETLLELKKNLKEEKNISEIEFPLTNWLKPVDINFQVTFKISKEL